jgi:hypothetical protein
MASDAARCMHHDIYDMMMHISSICNTTPLQLCQAFEQNITQGRAPPVYKLSHTLVSITLTCSW